MSVLTTFGVFFIYSAQAATAHWCMAAVIFISTCLGVVLEGPMGAVPFWIAVGLAYEGADNRLS